MVYPIIFNHISAVFFLITKAFPMFLQIHSRQVSQRDVLSRLADWWPAALIGLVALLGAVPDSGAQTLLGL